MAPGRVVAVGAVNVDLVIRVARLPGPGETVAGGDPVRAWGGKAANVAAAAAALGATAVLIAMVGDDEAGPRARDALADAGVQVAGVRTAAGRPTGTATILVDDEGANLIVLTGGANAVLDVSTVTSALAEVTLLAGDVVVLSMEVADDALVAAARAAHAAGARVVVNASPARALRPEILAGEAVVVVNDDEVRALAGTVADPVHAAQTLSGATGGAVVVTLGAAGAVCVRGAHVEPVSSPSVDVVDTTGAGDAFLGALAAHLAEGGDLVEAARHGALAGAYACTGAGARHHIDAGRLALELSGRHA